MVEQPYQYQRRELAEPDWRKAARVGQGDP